MHPGEKFNTISHLIAAVISVLGVFYLIFLALATSDPWKIISASIYGATLVLLYISSTLCHGHSGHFEKFFEKMDHIAIYLLIAGTYTPFMLVALRGIWSWSMLIVIWGLALIGILLDLWPGNCTDKEKEPNRNIQLSIYLIMGWMVVFVLRPLAAKIEVNGILLLVLGGILYSIGVIFFILSERIKHAHGVWHLLVIAGSLCHFISISVYVI